MSTIINVPLLAASFATGAKYAASALRADSLETVSKGAASALRVDGSTPYPLVGGKDLYGHDINVPITIKGANDTMYFPEAVVNVSRPRNLVATPVLNGKGTVKELITDGDIELSISLAVANTDNDAEDDSKVKSLNDEYPYKRVERLRKLLEEPNRLDIVSDFLKLFDLDGGDFGIVVKNYSVNQETHTNRQVFEIQAVSDYDYNLLIED